LESIDYGVPFDAIRPYEGGADDSVEALYICPSDLDPRGKTILDSLGNCKNSVPLAPPPGDLTSYLVNSYFIFGLSETQLSVPESTILIAERNDSFCDVDVRPWLGEIYDAPGSLGAVNGQTPYPACISSNPAIDHQFAVASERHVNGANYAFADGHVRWESYQQTIAPGPDQRCFGQYQALAQPPGP
jgi:prepilin-type processing-associated H-X9-DG protein